MGVKLHGLLAAAVVLAYREEMLTHPNPALRQALGEGGFSVDITTGVCWLHVRVRVWPCVVCVCMFACVSVYLCIERSLIQHFAL